MFGYFAICVAVLLAMVSGIVFSGNVEFNFRNRTTYRLPADRKSRKSSEFGALVTGKCTEGLALG